KRSAQLAEARRLKVYLNGPLIRASLQSDPSIMPYLPADSIVVFGVLQPDGSVSLDQPLAMSPGPVQLTIRPVSNPRERLPDPPIEDEFVMPPCEFPRSEIIREVQTVRIPERLPDALDTFEVD